MDDAEFLSMFGKHKNAKKEDEDMKTEYEKELSNFQFLTTYIDEY